MNDDKAKNQIPIFRFFYRHKWRIIIPVLIVVYYMGLPHSFDTPQTIISYQLSIKPTENGSLKSINQQVAKVADGIKSDESLLALVSKYDLFSRERKSGV